MKEKRDRVLPEDTWFGRVWDGIVGITLRHWPLVFMAVCTLRGDNKTPDLPQIFLVGAAVGWYGKWLSVWWKNRREDRKGRET